jgi:hypothetical protein
MSDIRVVRKNEYSFGKPLGNRQRLLIKQQAIYNEIMSQLITFKS